MLSFGSFPLWDMEQSSHLSPHAYRRHRQLTRTGIPSRTVPHVSGGMEGRGVEPVSSGLRARRIPDAPLVLHAAGCQDGRAPPEGRSTMRARVAALELLPHPWPSSSSHACVQSHWAIQVDLPPSSPLLLSNISSPAQPIIAEDRTVLAQRPSGGAHCPPTLATSGSSISTTYETPHNQSHRSR